MPPVGHSLFLREIVLAFGRLTPFRKLNRLLRHAFLWTTKTILRQFGDFNTPMWAERALSLVTRICPCFKAVIWFPANPTFLVQFVRCFGAHMLVFMVAAVACAIVAFYFLGYLIRLFHNRDPNDTKLGLFGFIWGSCLFWHRSLYSSSAPPVFAGFA